MLDITVVVPTIPPRQEQYYKLVESIHYQTQLPAYLIASVDVDYEGSAVLRNRMVQDVKTEWVTFADDDDTMKPNHLQVLSDAQIESGADVVYSWYDVVGSGTDPRPDMFGKPFDADELRRGSFITVNSLVRTSLAKQCPFEYVNGLDDWGFYLNLLNIGAIFHHVPVRTYNWQHHKLNTSGKNWKEKYAE